MKHKLSFSTSCCGSQLLASLTLWSKHAEQTRGKKALCMHYDRELAHHHVHTHARTRKLIARNYVLNHFMNDLVACCKIFGLIGLSACCMIARPNDHRPPTLKQLLSSDSS